MFYHTCTFCGAKGVNFGSIEGVLGDNLKKYGFPYELKDFETLSYKTYQCLNCDSADRDRLYKLYFDKYVSTNKPLNILEFAPCEPIRKWLTATKNVTYRTADLYMKGVDDKVDIMDMKKTYKNNTFDFFICSHILEHVEDDMKALKELRRILKKGGKGILMAPIITKPGAQDEDPSVKKVSERWRRFAQDDHVRIYDRETYLERIAAAGFKVTVYTYRQLGIVSMLRNGIDLKSKLYVVEKV